MKKLFLFSALCISASAAPVLRSAEAQSLPARSIELTCTRSVTPETSHALKKALFAEPFSCHFYYKVIRNGRVLEMGEWTAATPANSESTTVVKPISSARAFDSIEFLDATHSTALSLSKAWVGGRCKPVQNKYPKQTVSITRSPYVGVYQQKASLEERFACR